jgi:hypothetical protein
MYHRDVQLECFGELKSALFNDSHIGGIYSHQPCSATSDRRLVSIVVVTTIMIDWNSRADDCCHTTSCCCLIELPDNLHSTEFDLILNVLIGRTEDCQMLTLIELTTSKIPSSNSSNSSLESY